MEESKETSDLIAQTAAYLASIELALGSMLHAFKVPLAGHALSLNQIYVLAKTTATNRTLPGCLYLPWQSSLCVALLKSLSPAGKRLTPMLAISMQGLLLNLPLLIFGINSLSLTLGAVLASLWAFLQPLILILVFLGPLAFELVEFLKDITKPFTDWALWGGLLIAGILIMTKIVLAILIARMAQQQNNKLDILFAKFKTKQRFKINLQKKSGSKSAWAEALKETLNPWLLGSTFLTLFFLIYSAKNLNLPLQTKFWILLRPLALAFLIFYSFKRWPLFDHLIALLKKMRLTNLSQALEKTIEKHQESKI